MYLANLSFQTQPPDPSSKESEKDKIGCQFVQDKSSHRTELLYVIEQSSCLQWNLFFSNNGRSHRIERSPGSTSPMQKGVFDTAISLVPNIALASVSKNSSDFLALKWHYST